VPRVPFLTPAVLELRRQTRGRRSELGLRDLESLPAQPAVRVHELGGKGIQFGNVAAAKGDHDIAGKGVRCGRPPISQSVVASSQ
jgi:hypothetical protein